MGRIHRWVSQALDIRIDDVRSRRDKVATAKHEREVALNDDAIRTEKRRVELEQKMLVSIIRDVIEVTRFL